MPDHVHFFAAPEHDAKSLSDFMGAWKRWSSRAILKLLNMPPPLWQPEFFDHVLRSEESASEKWEYVRTNPVRHGLVERAEGWPYAGEMTPL
jgi:REP element-mobilizing transposase RayT